MADAAISLTSSASVFAPLAEIAHTFRKPISRGVRTYRGSRGMSLTSRVSGRAAPEQERPVASESVSGVRSGIRVSSFRKAHFASKWPSWASSRQQPLHQGGVPVGVRRPKDGRIRTGLFRTVCRHELRRCTDNAVHVSGKAVLRPGQPNTFAKCCPTFR